MRRSFKFRLRPTARQHIALAAMLEAHRELYNAALEERREAYQRAGVSIRYTDQSAQLKDIRAVRPDIAVWSFSSQQATLRRLNLAFAAFFRRVKAGQTPGYPRFKGRGWFDSVTWPADGDGCRWDSQPHAAQTRVYLQGVGHVALTQHRAVAGRVKTISVKREGRHWYVVLSCDQVPAQPLPPANWPVGLDVGVAHFATASTPVPGVTDPEGHISNPRHLRASAGRLARAQARLARCQRGSKTRGRVRATIGRRHRKVRNQRGDFHHKTARALVGSCDLIAREDLTIGKMTRSAKGTIEQPGTNVAAKSGLNKSILDAGWGQFLAILHGKAESAGRVVIPVDARNSSRTCPREHCGHLSEEQPPHARDLPLCQVRVHGQRRPRGRTERRYQGRAGPS